MPTVTPLHPSFVQSLAVAMLLTGCSCEEPAPPMGSCSADPGTPGPAPVLRIDVGREEGADRVDSGLVGDGPYSAERTFGWLGPGVARQRSDWDLGTGTSANLVPWGDEYLERVEPYSTWVEGLTGYRVDVPDGVYRVSLMLLEPHYPARGLRSFDVVSGGRVMISDLDLADVAGQDETVVVAIQVAATAGALTLEFVGKTDEPVILAGLVVEPSAEQVPPAPANLEVRAGAGESLLRWDQPAESLRGWLVERSVEGGSFEPAFPGILPSPVFVDRLRTPGESTTYRVSAVDASCQVGEAATSSSIAALAADELGLPVIDVAVSEADLRTMHLDPEAKVEVPATVTSGDESASGTIRLRGRSTLWMAKRSFKLTFESGTIDGRDRLLLLAEQPDPTRLWQLLGYDLFQRMGGLASRARPVLLRVNGEVYGVYDDIEHVGDAFLTSRGYGVDDRFRIEDIAFELVYDESDGVDLSGYEKKENEDEPSPELEELIVWLNTAAEHEVDQQLDSHVDRAVLVDYLAGQVLMANLDVIDGGHYLILDPAEDRFLLVPWDLNNLSWSWPDPSLSHFTFFDVGPEPPWWEVNWLWSRALCNPSFRADLIARVQALLDSVYAEEMDQTIDETHSRIAPALDVEPFLWRRRLGPRIAAGPDGLHQFVAQRRGFIETGLLELAELDHAGVLLSELGPAFQGSVDHVELTNPGSSPVDLQYCWLSDSPMQPRGQSLQAAGILQPGESLTVELVSAPIWEESGFLGLWCGDQHDGDEGYVESGCEADCYGFRSVVFHPPLTPGALYVRTGDQWALVDI